MNERIVKLFMQSVDSNYIPVPIEDHIPSWAEKFAELVVGECMDLALAEQKRYANISHRNMSECAVALGNFSLLIKDHFEDEE